MLLTEKPIFFFILDYFTVNHCVAQHPRLYPKRGHYLRACDVSQTILALRRVGFYIFITEAAGESSRSPVDG